MLFRSELEKNTELSVKEKTGVQGGSKTYRDFKDLAILDTIERNRDANNARDTNGIMSLPEIDNNL